MNYNNNIMYAVGKKENVRMMYRRVYGAERRRKHISFAALSGVASEDRTVRRGESRDKSRAKDRTVNYDDVSRIPWIG